MKKLYLLLGTNLGDRRANIECALKALDEAFKGRRLQFSGIIETEACGFDGPPFLNAVAVYKSARKPESILRICKQIEASMGRTDTPEYDTSGRRIYHNRLIDIDILMYGNIEVNTPILRIPHPQVAERPFVKELLKKISCAAGSIN